MADDLIHVKLKIGDVEIEASSNKIETVNKLIDDLQKRIDVVLHLINPERSVVQQYQQPYPQQQQMQVQPQVMSPNSIPQNAPPLQYPPNFR